MACFEVRPRNETTDEHRSTQINTDKNWDEKEILGELKVTGRAFA
jgi:hypothetical protein